MSSELFNHDPNRGKWASRYEFACAIVGNAVGLRSFALFSYYHQTCGGVAFLIPLNVMMIFVTAPLIFTEVFMGQFSSTGFLSVFRVSMFYKGLGFIMLVLNVGSVIYFGMVSAYPIAMIQKLVNYEIPWNSTATDEKFVDPIYNGIFAKYLKNKSAPEAYFLKRLDDIEIGWNDVSLANPIMVAIPIIWLCVAVCLIKGVKSVGKVVYFTVGTSFILLVTIDIRNFFSYGHLEGAKFFSNTVNWSKLGTWEAWMGCLILSTYLLGQGWGILVTMGSYNNFRESVKKNVAYLPLITMILSLMGIAFVEYFGNFLKIVAFIWSGLNSIRFSRDIEFTFNARNRSYEIYAFVTPILLLCAFIWLAVTGMPWLPPQTSAWPAALSKTFMSLSFLGFPAYILYRFYFKADGPWAFMMRESVKPKQWHPADETERLIYIRSTDKNSPIPSQTAIDI